MKYVFVLVCISLTLVGCKTPNKMPMAEYNSFPATKYAPVSVIVNDGQIISSSTYVEGAGQVTMVDPAAYCILSGLQNCGLFEYVDANNGQVPTVFVINFERKFSDPILTIVGKFTVSMITMFFLPVPYDYKYDMSIEIRHKNHTVAGYKYHEYLRDYFFFFEHVFDDHEKIIEVMLSKFYRDLQTDEVLDPYMARKANELAF